MSREYICRVQVMAQVTQRGMGACKVYAELARVRIACVCARSCGVGDYKACVCVWICMPGSVCVCCARAEI